ncbi:MAG: ATP synthase F1 subunit epsilon [Porphyromonadaceae bacterium]|nr:ATP synthase F1 subunit epsilon [Porphyromonadaceae bacterium]
MKLEIITPEQIIFSGEVTMVTVPGTKGRFTILENHAPIISSLGKGNIIYKVGEDEHKIFTLSGFVEVNNNEVSIAIEVAE